MSQETAVGGGTFLWEAVCLEDPHAIEIRRLPNEQRPAEISGIGQDRQLVARHAAIRESIRYLGVSGRIGTEYPAFVPQRASELDGRTRHFPDLHVANTLVHTCVAVTVEKGEIVRTNLMDDGPEGVMMTRYDTDNTRSQGAAIPGTVSNRDYMNALANRPTGLHRITRFGRQLLDFAIGRKSEERPHKSAPVRQSNVTVLPVAD